MKFDPLKKLEIELNYELGLRVQIKIDSLQIKLKFICLSIKMAKIQILSNVMVERHFYRFVGTSFSYAC